MKLSAALIVFLQAKTAVATLRGNDTADNTERKLAGNFYVTEYGTGGYCTDVGTPIPGSRTMYSTMEECCIGQFVGQPDALAFCYSKMPNPPTSKPTEAPTEAGTLTVWYPDYENTSWLTGKCINDGPLPSGRAAYATQKECCEKAYGGQSSRACVSDFQDPPTQAPTESPTEAGTLTVFYPVYGEGEGFCTNDPPTDHGLSSLNGIVTSATNAECCTKHFSWQKSGFCFSQMANPPTQAPTVTATEGGTMTVFYPVYGEGEGFCANDPPTDHGLSSLDGIVTSATNAECCTKHFSWQKSGFCFSQMANPPTQAPTVTATEAGTMTVFYPVYGEGEGFCTNDPPADHGLSSLDGIVTSATNAECCTKHFSWQKSGFCFSQMANPPTQAPTVTATEGGTMTVFYPVYGEGEGFCTNDPPADHGLSSLDGIVTSATNAECCTKHFSWQKSGFCFSQMANPPTQAPTVAATEPGTLNEFYPIRNQGSGFCTNEPPSTYGLNDIYEQSYPTNAECCKAYFSHQSDGFCYSKMGSPPTQAPTDAPTEAGSLTVWYPDYSKSWDMGVCINDAPLPSYATHYNYPTQKECCDNAYSGQSSGRCAAGYLG